MGEKKGTGNRGRKGKRQEARGKRQEGGEGKRGSFVGAFSW
jgi:hypothetical protein